MNQHLFLWIMKNKGDHINGSGDYMNGSGEAVLVFRRSSAVLG